MSFLKSIMLQLILLILISVPFSSCSATGKTYLEMNMHQIPIPSNSARIYLLRKAKMEAMAQQVPITINGNLHSFLKNGGFLYIDIEPGKYVITNQTPPLEGLQSIEVNAEPGKAYYIRVGITKEGRNHSNKQQLRIFGSALVTGAATGVASGGTSVVAVYPAESIHNSGLFGFSLIEEAEGLNIIHDLKYDEK